MLRHLRQAEPRRLEHLELRVLPFQPVLLSGVARLRVVQSTRGSTAGVQSFQIAADVAGKEQARFWVKAEVRVYEQVVVAARPLGRQETLSAKDLRLERREITGRTAQIFTRFDDVVGKQSIRAIQYADPPSIREIAPNLPVELESVIIRCLEKQPSARFSSACGRRPRSRCRGCKRPTRPMA